MDLYSYKGQEPKELPFRLNLESGGTLTSLNQLDPDFLESLGFAGPILTPSVDENTQKLEWNGSEYVVVDLTEDEINHIELLDKERRRENINYKSFKEKFLQTSYYQNLLDLSKTTIEAGFVLSQFINELNDRVISEDKSDIQSIFSNLFFVMSPSQDDVNEIQLILEETNLDTTHFVPDSNMLSGAFFDMEIGTVIVNKPFESWVLIEGRWMSPIPYPTDNKFYYWDEQIKNWVESV